MTEVTVLIAHKVPASHVAALRARFSGVRFVHLAEDGAAPEAGQDAEVLLRCAMPKDVLKRVVDNAPRLRWLHTCTAGFDWLMIPSVVERGLTISRSARAYNEPIAECVLAYILYVAKRLPHMLAAQADRRWAPIDPDELTGQTVGVVGAGSIGSEVAKRCQAFGMRTLGLKRTPAPVDFFDRVMPPDALPALLEQSDYVVLACPLTTETRGMLGAAQLRHMKPTAHLINIARGALLVEADFIQAMREGWIAGAYLDAFVQEPLPPDSPLWDLPNTVVTPHYSYRSPHGMDRIVEEFAANLARYLAGEPVHNQLGDPGLGY